MRWSPGEADGARAAASSPGLPRGTRIDQEHTPQELGRAPRADAPERHDESSGDHQHADPPPTSRLVAPERSAGLVETAIALADAFLAASAWRPAELSAAGTTTVGRRPGLVEPAVAAVLAVYPRAPRDAPRRLAGVLASDRSFTAAFARLTARRPVRLRVRTVAPVVAAPVAAHVPVVDALPDLATLLGVTTERLLWFADTRGWNRRVPAGSPLHHYEHRWVQRPGRTPRLLEAPLHQLRTMQRVVLDQVLAPLPLSDAVHGFVRGRSALSGAEVHVGHDVVVSADLVSFFAAVPASRVYGIFRRVGYAEPVAHVLTGLCTHVVPDAVLRAMPPGGDLDERWALRQALATPHLPQGAPSSPALANLSLRRLDARLAGWAQAADAVYTRYADDLAFSGDGAIAARPDAFLRGVDRIVADEGHALNPRKTRVRRQGVRQSVTGVVVNAVPGVGRRELDRLRAVLHNCVRYGPASQDRGDHADFRAHLEGRVGWVEQVHPARGAALRAEFERIAW
ncbi:RNA-directed DNA polymerase [Curtobacterium sp. MCBD17_034]|uniref:reverse transcriptase family protein n=1 Tax=unclassified Curtobacterium TaxID=257496 RepID=UPI000DA6FCFF|nr:MULTISPECIES: reverse transcriptase family protein [unclassified Curtobacterium]PZF58472.1 RNA-directed DNA polymerase [Curtobacterium sp. MCBD17_034]PZM34461.1 RNA-directed DNA polymerase [Curtobacterium sp. MCBD17_031]